MNLVHAQPSVSCAAVSHDAVVARHSERHPAREAVSVNDCNGWDYREHAVSNEGHGSTLLNALTRKCHEPEQHGVEHDYASKISISGGAAQSEVCQYARGKKFVRKVGSLVAFAKSRPGRTHEVASVRAIHDSNHLTRRLTVAEELVLISISHNKERTMTLPLLFRRHTSAPVLAPVSLDRVERGPHSLREERFREATVRAIVHLEHP